MQSSDPPNYAARRAWLAFVFSFMVVDFLVWPVMDAVMPGVLGKMVLGAFIAQAGLLASWIVLAPFPLSFRIVTSAIMGFAWLATSVWSFSLNTFLTHRWYKDATIGCALVPILAIGFLAPLWIVQGWLRWRIVPLEQSRFKGEPDRGWARQQMVYPVPMEAKERHEGVRTRDIFTGMTVVAIAFGAVEIARAVIGLDDSFRSVYAIPAPNDLLMGTLIGAIWTASISLLVVLPLVAATLHARRVWLALLVTAILQLLVFVGAIFVLYERIIDFSLGLGPLYIRYEVAESNRDAGYLPMTIVMAVSPIFGGLWISFSAIMLVVRWWGYRLVWGPIRTPTAASGSGPT